MQLPSLTPGRFTYAILPEKGLIVERFRGVFSFSQVISSVQSLWADPRYSRAFDGVVDLSETAIHMPISDFQRIIEMVSGHENTTSGRWAAIVTSPLATAYLSIYKKAIAHRHIMEIFSTWEGATFFLGVEKDPDVEKAAASLR